MEWLAGAGALTVFLGAVAAAWRTLSLGPLLKGTRLFLLDWFGEPARPGVDARPSFPERMATVESRTKALNHDLRDDLGGRLALLTEMVEASSHASKQVAEELKEVNGRVTEHRRRNDDQIRLLREAVARLEARQIAILPDLPPVDPTSRER